MVTIASIASSIPIFGGVFSSLTQTRAPPRAWTDLEMSQSKGYGASLGGSLCNT